MSQVTAAPASLAGGAGTAYDTGTVTANVNGTVVTTSYGQSSTAQTVAAALATAISGSGAGVTATPGTSGTITVTASQTGTAANGWAVTLSSATNQPNFFSSASFSGTSGTLSGGVDGSTAGPLYQYTIPAPGAPLGYDAHGNLLSYSDCVNNNCATSDCLNNFCGVGTWSANYDNLNRVSGASASAGPWSGLGMGWTYDSFGNRKTQTLSGTPPTGVPQSQTLNYPSQNRISNFGSSAYDAAGNITYDLINQYAYDAEGRVCAVAYHSGMTTAYMVYIYDADGRRVAKGSNPTFSCTPATTGFAMQETYLLGQSGEHVTELDGSGGFLRSHVYADGHLLATYENNTTQFAFNDWLGSTRLVARPLGQVTGSCINLPFGDDLTCSSNVPLDGHHFTGQIHDKESGNDYFEARYYSNYTGRFMSPDWSASPEAVPYSDLTNPQSLNLYGYVGNNPLSKADLDGHQQEGAPAREEIETEVREEAEMEVRAQRGMRQAHADEFNRRARATGATGPALSPEQVENAEAEGHEKIHEIMRAGRYEFSDATNPGKTYVGQSEDMPNRATEHMRSGKLAEGETVKMTPVPGGK